MNILAQCCGVVLMIVILYFHSNQKKIHLYTERAFVNIWRITFLSLILDILSMVVLTYRSELPEFLVQASCKAYVASLVWVAIFCVNYVSTDIYAGQEHYRQYQRGLILAGVFLTVGVFALPIYISTENAAKTYTYGPATTVTYVLAASFLVLLVFLMHKNKDTIKPRLRRVMWAWMGVWVLGTVIEFISIQFINEALLVVGYASAVGTVIIYLRLENPEANLDWKTGFFNQNAFLMYTKQLLEQEREFCLLCMSYTMGVGDNVPADTEEIILMDIARFISKIQGPKVFRITEDEIVFLFYKTEELECVYRMLSERFKEPWGRENMHMISPRWFCLMETGLVKRSEDFMNLFHYMTQRVIGNNVDENDFILMDESVITEVRREKEVEALLVEAMEEDRVTVFFQPIYSTRKYQFVSAEALVRIYDAEGNMIPPGEFIEVAEKTGLIVKLGEMVFEKVCRFIQKENPAQYGIEYIEVNLSVIQCGYEYLAESFIRIMKEYKISPKHINLEITETASLNEKRMLLMNMRQLREFGVTFSLDDFGTGRSNLNYIVDMPVDIVKFDKDMIQAYFRSDKAKYVMDAAMHMIQGLELHIVSEGIETEEQYATMEKLGISYIQGFYFSKPLPGKEFLEFIRQEARGG